MSQYKTQYNNQYQKRSYNNNNSSDSNGGTAEITSTKKDGVILKVILNNQNLVLKGFFDNRTKGWKLFPYYDKRKQNPSFNQPKQSYQQNNDMDDQLPQSEQEWSQRPATDFDPEELENQLGD
tara:strand:- start:42 stop:410 length:369 start_codon:yes stop_codon:yes gene_type:complete